MSEKEWNALCVVVSAVLEILNRERRICGATGDYYGAEKQVQIMNDISNVMAAAKTERDTL